MQEFLNSSTHNVSWFLKHHNSGELQLRPPFQRNPVWTTKQKAYLIDTILRGYPVPELYMQEYTDASGSGHYVVVDGQQRIRACIEFERGEFPLDENDSPEWGDVFFDDLDEEHKKKIYNYKFVVRTLPETSDEELRAMFRRLNRNVVTLNQQELRHATYWGEFITCMEKIADDDIWSSLGIFTPNDVRRMLDVEYISELAIGYLHGPQNKKYKLSEWFQTYEREFPYRHDVEAVFTSVTHELVQVLPDFNRVRWRRKSDFYSLFLFVARSRDVLPLSREGRSALNQRLRDYAQRIDKALGEDEPTDSDEAVKRYAHAVEKAASDLGNRKARQQCLEKWLGPVLERERGVSCEEESDAGEGEDEQDASDITS